MPRKSKNPERSEVKVYGLHACLALSELRPDDIIRVYVVKEMLGRFGSLLKFCAKTQRAYHVVEPEKMANITASTHHEGICILAYERGAIPEAEFFRELKTARVDVPLVYFDGTKNPHNVGAMLRTLAHFGVQYAIGSAEDLPRVSGSLARISKGGSERVQLVKVKDALGFCKKLKSFDYEIVKLSNKVKRSIYEYDWRQKTMLIFGNESFGVSKGLSALATTEAKIPGTDTVESLNVSVACGIVLNEWSRGRN